MKIANGLLARRVGDIIAEYTLRLDIDVEQMVTNDALIVLTEIQSIFERSDIVADDFLLVEEIIEIFHRHGLTTGSCHDF